VLKVAQRNSNERNANAFPSSRKSVDKKNGVYRLKGLPEATPTSTGSDRLNHPQCTNNNPIGNT
jgi:hypothetical protein